MKVQTKNNEDIITLYPDFRGCEKNGYIIHMNMKTFDEWNDHLMQKNWFNKNPEIQKKFKIEWNKIKGEKKQ
jgi:hypothetical protein|tara:strand:+ start:297 stop:512 length:216 start_codon:yes stop_codon:yes gene_type:complete